MVYVSIDALDLGKNSIYIDMSVFGVYPKDSKEVMEVLTQVFSRLVFKYPFNDELHELGLHELGHFFAMLARKKVYIASIPEDTHEFNYHPSLEEALKSAKEYGNEIVDLFVDVGSPFKHIYIVSRGTTSYSGIKACGYNIAGWGPNLLDRIDIHVDFASEPPRCTATWCTEEFMERMEKLMKDNGIHVEPYPGMKNRVTKLLLKKAIELAKESGS
jgi:hypothetical protein